MTAESFVDTLRNAAPYVHAHNGRVFVVAFGGEAAERSNFRRLIYDLALLHSLGVRLVLVHGARPQIDRLLAAAGIDSQIAGGLRVTDSDSLECVKQAVGSLRTEIEALLSTGLANTPMGGARLRIVSGNLVTARPVGIQDGVDFQHTGTVRRIDSDSIREHLQRGNIVLLSPLGYSPTGEVFNLHAETVAQAVAQALPADKLVLMHAGPHLHEHIDETARQLSAAEAKRLLETRSQDLGPELTLALQTAIEVIEQVSRVHLLSHEQDGALLNELFSRDGTGTLVTAENYDSLRQATVDDIGGVLKLIEPLEASGALVARSREQLELEIAHFTVMLRDNSVIACCALYAYPEEAVGELGCLAVEPDYRSQKRAETLLQRAEAEARQHALTRLFVLTTQAPHWFIEHGFDKASLDDLPIEKKRLYNYQRNSQVLVKRL